MVKELKVETLHIGDILIDQSWLVLAYKQGEKVRAPVYTFLIFGGEEPILIDTGFRAPEFMERWGMKGYQTKDQTIENQLKRFGLAPKDIKYVVHTHLHGDHSGKDSLFPNARFYVQKAEMEWAMIEPVDGSPDALWLLEHWDRVEFLDGDLELMPGIKCVLTGGHSPGHQAIYVDTGGNAPTVIVGDELYSVKYQLEEPPYTHLTRNVWPIGYCANIRKHLEWAYRWKHEVLQRGGFLLPTHDYVVVERWGGTFPPKRSIK